MATLLLNPKKRRKSRKHRSPAQRAATRKMLAANRRRSPRRARRASHAVLANPVRRSRRRSYRHNPVSRARRYAGSIRASGAMNLLKSGAFMGVGAVASDILFGQLQRFLPASMATPIDATGATNWLYFAAKAAVAVGIGTFGRKVLPAKLAESAAVGSLAVLAYQITRSMVPASLTMGAYVNPGRVMGPRMNGLRGMNSYHALPQPGAQVLPMRGAAMAFQRR